MAEHSRRRRVIRISPTDQRLIDDGVAPSWDEKVTSRDREREGAQRHNDHENDARLLDTVPPHWQVRSDS